MTRFHGFDVIKDKPVQRGRIVKLADGRNVVVILVDPDGSKSVTIKPAAGGGALCLVHANGEIYVEDPELRSICVRDVARMASRLALTANDALRVQHAVDAIGPHGVPNAGPARP